MKIQDEGTSRRLDNLGRITIPKSVRNRLKCETNQEYEVYTIEIDGKVYIAFGPVGEEK